MTFERAQAPKPEWRLPLAAPGLRYLKLVEVDSHERNPLAIVSDILPPLEHNLAHLTGAADCLPPACLLNCPTLDLEEISQLSLPLAGGKASVTNTTHRVARFKKQLESEQDYRSRTSLF